MFDIDGELKQLHIENRSVDPQLRQKVLHMVFEAADSGKKPQKAVRRLSFAAVCATALVLAAIVIFAVLPVSPAAYYTIDINPSVSVAVDNADTVLFMSAENSDAEKLLGGLALEGLSFEEALRAIVQQASASGYLNMDGHVLVGHFGSAPGLSSSLVEAVVRDVAGDTVKVLLLESTKREFENAQKQHKKAGIALLEKEAEALDVQGRSQEDLIDAVRGEKTGTHNNKKSGGDNDAKNVPAVGTGKQNSAGQTDAAETKKPGSSENANENASDGAKQSSASQGNEDASDNAKQKTSGQGQENANNNRSNDAKENANSNSGNNGQEDDKADKGKPAVPGRS